MSEAMVRIQDARMGVQKAKEELHAAVQAAFPVGTWVEFPWSRGFMRGVIIGYTDWWWTNLGMCLRLDSTGREFQVDAWHLYHGALEDE